jgi:predicted Rossmann-fold nucleotide-binding protein
MEKNMTRWLTAVFIALVIVGGFTGLMYCLHDGICSNNNKNITANITPTENITTF